MVAIGIRTAPELAGMVMQAIVLGKLNQIPLGFGIIPFSLLARFLVDQRELVPVLAMRLTSRFSLLSITARWRGRAAIFFRDSFPTETAPTWRCETLAGASTVGIGNRLSGVSQMEGER